MLIHEHNEDLNKENIAANQSQREPSYQSLNINADAAKIQQASARQQSVQSQYLTQQTLARVHPQKLGELHPSNGKKRDTAAQTPRSKASEQKFQSVQQLELQVSQREKVKNTEKKNEQTVFVTQAKCAEKSARKDLLNGQPACQTSIKKQLKYENELSVYGSIEKHPNSLQKPESQPSSKSIRVLPHAHAPESNI